jgi:CRISPR-associated protein Cmr5
MMRTQRVATAAYGRVSASASAPFKKEYGALAHKLPGMILQNGLAQATGFLLAKGRPEHQHLLEDLNAVLRAAGVVQTEGGNDLHQAIIAADLAHTLRLTRAALDATAWLKRYVQGLLRVDATGAADTEECS